MLNVLLSDQILLNLHVPEDYLVSCAIIRINFRMELEEQLSPISINSDEQRLEPPSIGGFIPTKLCSTVNIQEATNRLHRLQIIESPKSRLKCSDRKHSRLTAEAKGKILFQRSKTM